MSLGELLRQSPTGVLNDSGQNVCWLAPTVHILLKDPTLSHYLLDKLDSTPTSSSNAESVLLMLANQFRQHSSAVDLEFLLDVLGQDFPELVRVDTTARRRATQEQLDWSEGPAFFLGALTAAASPTEDESVFASVFKGSIQTFFMCGEMSCARSKRTGEPQPGWVLQLPTHGSMCLDTAMESYFFAREFEADCNTCGPVTGQECARLCRLPSTFLINIKRVVKWDAKYGAVKTIASVQYPMELPMAKYCTRDSLQDGWGSLYSLGGVVLHHGSSGNGGHYTYIQRQAHNKWVLFDDDKAPLPKSPKEVLGYRQLVCGLVYHRNPPSRDSTVVPLYKALPSPRLAQSSVSTEVPECETALSTLPALGTAKHRLSQLQQADLERKQAEVTAQRKAAAERKAQLAQQLAEKEKEVRRKQEREARQADHDKVEDAKQRMKAAEARQQQRLLKEREAQEQQKRAAKAAKDAARMEAVPKSAEPTTEVQHAAPASLSKKERAQAKLAEKRTILAKKKAEEAASAAAARQLIEAQAAAAAEQAAIKAAAASQRLLAAAATEQGAAEAAAATEQLLQAEAAAAAEKSPVKAAAEEQLEAEAAAAAEQKTKFAAAAEQAAGAAEEAGTGAAAATQRQLVAKAVAAAEQEAAEAAAAAAWRQQLPEATADAEQEAVTIAALEETAWEQAAVAVKLQTHREDAAAGRLKAKQPSTAEKQARQSAVGAEDSGEQKVKEEASFAAQQTASKGPALASSMLSNVAKAVSEAADKPPQELIKADHTHYQPTNMCNRLTAARGTTLARPPAQTVAGHSSKSSAASGVSQRLTADASHAGSSSGQLSQQGSDQLNCPADADVCNCPGPATELSHVELSYQMAAKHHSCHNEVPQDDHQPEPSSQLHQDTAVQVSKTAVAAPSSIFRDTALTQNSLDIIDTDSSQSSSRLLTPDIQAALDANPAANADQLANTQQAQCSTAADPAESSPAANSSGQLSRQGSDEASCPADDDSCDSQSPADEQTPAPVSAKPGHGGEQEVLPMQKAGNALKAALSSTAAKPADKIRPEPNLKSGSCVKFKTALDDASAHRPIDTLVNATSPYQEETSASTELASGPHYGQTHHYAASQHDTITASLTARRSTSASSAQILPDNSRYLEADVDSNQPVGLPGHDSNCPGSDAGVGNQQGGMSGSAVTVQERSSQEAAAAAEARKGLRSTVQALDAEDLFAPWYGSLTPSAPLPHHKPQTNFHPKRNFLAKLLHGAKRLVQKLHQACQQHPNQVAALAGVALAGAATGHHCKNRKTTASTCRH